MRTVEQYLEDWKDIEWSASRVSSFKNCPYNFYGTYILGLSSDNYFAYRGSAVHEVMEDYYNHLAQYDMPLEAVRKHLTGMFEQKMDECPHEAVMYYSGGQREMNHNNIIKSFEKWTPMPHVKYVEREIKFKVHGHKFRAFLDVEKEYERLSPSGTKEKVTLHSDYKSSWDSKKYAFQQNLYLYGKELVDGHKPAGFEIIEYKNGFKSVTVPYDELSVKWATSDANDVIEDIKKALETDCFPKNPENKFFCQNLCKMCEYSKTN